MAQPDYLKSLEEMLQGSKVSNAVAAQQPQPQSLSSIISSTRTEELQTDTLKFLLVSTHIHQTTGYSKVSHGIIQELSKHPWIHLTHFAFQKTNDKAPTNRNYPSSVDVMDVASLEQPFKQGFNYNLLPEVIRKKKPNIVMIYNDLTVVTQFLEVLRVSGVPRTFQLWVYCDQVYPVQIQAYLDVLNRDADRVFAFTPYWKKCLKDQGITRPIDVLLHGFDSKSIFTVPREIARKQVALPADMFLILNMNPVS